MSGERDLDRLITGMRPVLRAGSFVMVTLAGMPEDVDVHATVCEEEGLTVVVESSVADAHGWPYEITLAWISLEVHSALDSVGLTAAFSSALAAERISCNVLAGRFHDHLLVPADQAQAAMSVLTELSRSANGRP